MGLRPQILKKIYMERVRPVLPRGEKEYGGVRVMNRVWLDRIFAPEMVHPAPSRFENVLVSFLREEVEEGDDVVIIGGGLGVTSVTAAREAGPSGNVTCFEGSAEKVEQVRETACLNGVSDLVDVRHMVVGEGKNLWGDRGGAGKLDPEKLPACDVLEMDCEGAELGIIERMDIRPRKLAVESHGVYGSPTEEVRRKIEEKGYEVVGAEVAEEGGMEEKLREDDVRVVEARLKSPS